jgi:hypothetical protein
MAWARSVWRVWEARFCVAGAHGGMFVPRSWQGMRAIIALVAWTCCVQLQAFCVLLRAIAKPHCEIFCAIALNLFGFTVRCNKHGNLKRENKQ